MKKLDDADRIARRKARDRKYYLEHRETIKVRSRQYTLDHVEDLSVYHKQYRAEHFQERQVYARQYRADNPEMFRRYKKAWEQKPENRRKIAAARKERRRADPGYRVLLQLRKRLKGLIKSAGVKKTSRTLQIIGCSLEELRHRIETQFLPGMTWANRHLWHIDHIKPCKLFDFSDPVQQRACFHFSNLRPLWAMDNFNKGTKHV